MVDTKALLKGLGAGVDVVGQIATDKAVNARRRTRLTFDIRNGQLFENLVHGGGGVQQFRHGLGRIPKGAQVLKATGPVYCASTTLNTFDMVADSQTTFSVWVV